MARTKESLKEEIKQLTEKQNSFIKNNVVMGAVRVPDLSFIDLNAALIEQRHMPGRPPVP